MGVICGVTTNPSLIAKEGGRSQEDVLKEIASIVDGPISGEVKATTVDAEGMIAEGREIAKLHENIEYDIRTGCTHYGVNRDEIFVKINGVSAREFGSQGQVKSAALVMKLAQAEIFKNKNKDAPVVFLDDVMGELDESRQKFVFNIIKDMQVFVTTCNESALLPEIKGKILRISSGEMEEET